MTGPDRPARSRWPLSIAGSCLLHAGAAAAITMVQRDTTRPVEAPVNAPAFTVTLEMLTPETLAGVQTLRPAPDAAVTPEPPTALPPVSGSPDARAVPDAVAPAAPDPVAPERVSPLAPSEAVGPEGIATIAPSGPDPVRVMPSQARTPVTPLAADPMREAVPLAGVPVSPAPVSPVTPINLDLPAAGVAVPTVNAVDGTIVAALPSTILPPVSGPVLPAARATDATGTSATSPPPPSEQDIAVGALLDRVDAVPGTACALALPRRAGRSDAALTLVGTQSAALDTLARAILTGPLEGTPQTRALVDGRQCPVLDWVREMEAYPATRLGLRLDANVVDSGTSLTGTVQGVAGRVLTLVMIDDNGVVQDLTPWVTQSGNLARLDVPVARDGPNRDTRQVVLALATREVPGDLRARFGRLAQDVFTGLPDTLAQGDFALDTIDIR